MGATLTAKNTYLDKFKKDDAREEAKQKSQFDKVFEMDDEELVDAHEYCKKCKRESRWCKHRREQADHKEV